MVEPDPLWAVALKDWARKPRGKIVNMNILKITAIWKTVGLKLENIGKALIAMMTDLDFVIVTARSRGIETGFKCPSSLTLQQKHI
jgi:hypothetical protein